MSRRRVLAVAAAAVAVLATLGIGVACAGRNRAPAPSAGPTVGSASTTGPGGTVPSSPGAAPPSPAAGSPRSPGGPATAGRTASPDGTPSSRVPGVPARLAGQDVERIPTAQPVVALTFDAGANADGLPSILATLAREHVPATFFLTGDFASRYPSAIRSIVAAGHRLGNHSATHPAFTSLSDAAIRDQLSRARTAIMAAGGTDPRPLFRFPLGDRDRRTIAAGYVAVRWTVDSLGWEGTGSISAAGVVSRVVGAAGPGEIVLMHVGSNPDDRSTLDADALPQVVARLRASGYRFATLDALLG